MWYSGCATKDLSGRKAVSMPGRRTLEHEYLVAALRRMGKVAGGVVRTKGKSGYPKFLRMEGN